MKLSSTCSSRPATSVVPTLFGIVLTLCVVGIGGFASAIPAAHAAPPAVNDLTPAADSAIAKQDWTHALNELDARIKANPRDAQAKFKRATVLAHMGRDDDAITAFIELTQLYPELPEPYNNLAVLYAKEGRYEDARAALEIAVKATPSYGLAYENLGDLYLRLASAAYQRAMALGHASENARQRLADLQKIVSPPVATRHHERSAAQQPSTQTTATGAYTTTPYSTLDNPAFQFGGSTGSLALPPYMAPAR